MPGIPIWLGGGTKAAFERASRLAEGFIFFGSGRVDTAVESWQALCERVPAVGRPVEYFGTEYVVISMGAHAANTEIAAWRAAGGTRGAVPTMGFGLNIVDAHIDCLTKIADTLNSP